MTRARSPAEARPGRRRLAAALAAALVVTVAAVVLLDRGAAPERRDPGRDRAGAGPTRRISDERSRSYWAYVRSRLTARRAPAASAAQVAQIGLSTSVQTREVVLALAERRAPGGRLWTRVRLPVRSARATGWVPRSQLGAYHLVTTRLQIDRAALAATLYDAGRAVWRAPVAVGTVANPTPAGSFYVRSRIVPTEGGAIAREGFYGVFAFGTSAHAPGLSDWPGGGVVGIHGTNRPDLIPGRVSRGCVRLSNAKIARLRELMPLGTPVEISG